MDTDGQHYYFTHQAKCCVNETIWPACSGEGRLCCDTQCGAILRLPVTYLPKPFEPVQ